jgi:hypothetical protein
MLRLDPAHPPVWRTATTLQFGADAVALVHDPAPWQQRLVHELARGIPDDALEPVAAAFGAPDRAAAAFVRGIRRALQVPAPAAARSATLQAPTEFPRVHVDAVAQALVSCGFEVRLEAWHDAPDEAAPAAGTVVAVAMNLVHPRRAAALMSGDVAHLPVVFTGTGAEVGPYVRPGRTPCLACVAAHRRDADPTWPLVAAQLFGRAVEVDRSVACEAGIVAARLISEGERRATRQTTQSLTLRAGSLHRSAREHRPHAECRCRSLSGSARAADPAVLAPTRAKAFARPA